MAHTPLKTDRLLGWSVTGPMGGLTWYTSARRKIVAYYDTQAGKAPSPTQVVIQNRFRQASYAWRSLTRTQRRAWLDAARRTSQCATGFNLFVQAWCTSDLSIARTVFRQAHMGAPPWPPEA